MRKALLLSALLFACSSDDNQNADGGQDATAQDVASETRVKATARLVLKMVFISD